METPIWYNPDNRAGGSVQLESNAVEFTRLSLKEYPIKIECIRKIQSSSILIEATGPRNVKLVTS